MKEKFSNMLLTFLTTYNVLIWNYNYPFASYLGSELLDFIENAETIKDFLTTNFVKSKLLEDLYNSLLVWKKITHFFIITTIDDVKKYEKRWKLLLKILKSFMKLEREYF